MVILWLKISFKSLITELAVYSTAPLLAHSLSAFGACLPQLDPPWDQLYQGSRFSTRTGTGLDGKWCALLPVAAALADSVHQLWLSGASLVFLIFTLPEVSAIEII